MINIIKIDRYRISFIVTPLVLAIITAISINLKLTNYYFGFSVAVLLLVIPNLVFNLWDKYGCRGMLQIFALQLFVFFLISGVGIGIFYIRLRNNIVEIEKLRPRIVELLNSGNPELPGIYFSKTFKNGMVDIAPCWSNDVIVYYNEKDYCIVVPVTRPLFISFSSFKVLTWEVGKGWSMDRISWMFNAMNN